MTKNTKSCLLIYYGKFFECKLALTQTKPCYGVRFYYPDPIAKSIEEITQHILETAKQTSLYLKNSVFFTVIKDGWVIYQSTHKRDTFLLPEKAFRHAFAILRNYTLFEQNDPIAGIKQNGRHQKIL